MKIATNRGIPDPRGHAPRARPPRRRGRRAPGPRPQGAALRVRAPDRDCSTKCSRATRRRCSWPSTASPIRATSARSSARRRVRRAGRDRAAAPLGRRERRGVEDLGRRGGPHPRGDGAEPHPDAEGAQGARRLRARPRRRRRRLAARPSLGRPADRDRRRQRGQGLSRLVAETCDAIVSIPIGAPPSRSTPASRHPSRSTRSQPRSAAVAG